MGWLGGGARAAAKRGWNTALAPCDTGSGLAPARPTPRTPQPLPTSRLALAANRDRMPVPQPTSSTTLSLNRNGFFSIADWYARVRTLSLSISSWMPAGKRRKGRCPGGHAGGSGGAPASAGRPAWRAWRTPTARRAPASPPSPTPGPAPALPSFSAHRNASTNQSSSRPPCGRPGAWAWHATPWRPPAGGGRGGRRAGPAERGGQGDSRPGNSPAWAGG